AEPPAADVGPWSYVHLNDRFTRFVVAQLAADVPGVGAACVAPVTTASRCTACGTVTRRTDTQATLDLVYAGQAAFAPVLAASLARTTTSKAWCAGAACGTYRPTTHARAWTAAPGVLFLTAGVTDAGSEAAWRADSPFLPLCVDVRA